MRFAWLMLAVCLGCESESPAPYAPSSGINPAVGQSGSGAGDGDGDDGDVDRPMLPPGDVAYAFNTSDTKWNTKVDLAEEGKRGGEGAVTVHHQALGDKATLGLNFIGEDAKTVMQIDFTLIETNTGKKVFAPTTYDVMPGGIGQGVHVEGAGTITPHESDYCRGSMNGQLKIREITFGDSGDVSSFKGTLDAECPSGGSDVRATWSYESGDPVMLRGDEDECQVPGDTGYCWTVEVGAYAGGGVPREFGGETVMGFATDTDSSINVRFSKDGSDTGVSFWMGEVEGGPELMVNHRYSSDDLHADDSIELSVPGSTGCGTPAGWFEILEKQETTTSLLAKLAVDLRYECGDRVLRGKIRVNSDLP